MPELYRRRIVVDIAGLTITEPRIAVDITRQMDPTQDRGWVKIYNLTPDHADKISDRGERIVVQAGYPETVAIVFEGRVQRVRRLREGLAFIVEITLGDQVQSKRLLSGSYNRSWDGVASCREIAVSIISEGLGLLAGPLQHIPEGATFNNFYWAGGPATAALSALLRPLGLTWYEDDGVVRVNRVGYCQPDGFRIVASPKSGLVGAPIKTDEGAECTLLCEPRAKVGGEIAIKDSATFNDRFKIVGVRHVLDNWEGEFVTSLDLRPLAEPPAPG